MADFTPRKCAVEDCSKPERQWQRGWCPKHYERWRKHGDPTYYHWDTTPAERFWPKVDASGDCWEWRGGKNHLGYGTFSVNGKNTSAHRFAWKILVGPIPADLELDHLCRNHPCVNPDHLEPVTHAENMRRAPWTAVQVKRAQTHCKRGHLLYRMRDGNRRCEVCPSRSSRTRAE